MVKLHSTAFEIIFQNINPQMVYVLVNEQFGRFIKSTFLPYKD